MVIGEAGSCHGGDLDQAHALIGVATRCGADAVKFQTFKAETLAMRRRAAESLPMYAKYEMPLWWLESLKTEADRCGIEFMTTVYHEDYLSIVAPFVRRFKIGSFEAQDEAFLLAHKPFGKPVIVSTGLCDEAAIRRLRGHRLTWPTPLALLYCVSAYPTPLEALRLCQMRLQELDGFSDHTESVLTGALAVAAGATIIEKHLRLDDTDPANPDYGHSLSPNQFALYVQNTRLAEAAMGDGRKTVAEAEAPWARYVVRP